MKNLRVKTSTAVILTLFLVLSGCKGGDSSSPTPTGTKPDYQVAIEAKFATLGWDKDGHVPFNGTGIVKTTAGKGYVQYYAFGGRKTAIYYYPATGAFGMDTNEMTKYDAAGQDNFAYVTSDPKSSGAGSAHNELTRISDNSAAFIITTPNVGVFYVHGPIYAKYVATGRWTGPLGYPTGDVSNTPANATDKGTFVTFQTGGIWNTPTIGTQAIWGKAYKMWVAVDWERSWLKYLTTSCDPALADNRQFVRFQNGGINTGPTCPAYSNTNNETVYKDGTRAANVSLIPCY